MMNTKITKKHKAFMYSKGWNSTYYNKAISYEMVILSFYYLIIQNSSGKTKQHILMFLI